MKRLRLLSYRGFATVLIVSVLISSCALQQGGSVSAPSPAKEGHDDATAKKKRFFAFMRPAVERENARILKQREYVLKLRRRGNIGYLDRIRLNALARDYGLGTPDWSRKENWDALLARVDIIPAGLVLVQAANESAWGSSRFAREGNNYFGEWCFTKGCGIVPRSRRPGATHEVERFASMQDSVRSYMHNLNTLPAYARFRQLRAMKRRMGQEPDALTLATGLTHYSERGSDYVRTLQGMLKQNASLMGS